VSQSGVLSVATGGGSVVETLTGNSGGAVGPDGSFNINVLGNNSSGINIVGNPGTNTLTVTAFQATTTQEGTITLATNAQTIAGVNTANAVVPSSLAAKLGTQTAHNVAVFEGTSSALTAISPSTTGFVLTSNGLAADPSFQTISASGALTTIDGDTGSATPTAGVITFNANSNCGSTVEFAASGSTVDLKVSSALSNTIIGAISGNGTISGSSNTGLGVSIFEALTSGTGNTAVGFTALNSVTSNGANTGIGTSALVLATGSNNTAVGYNTLDALLSGSTNVALGSGAGSGYTGSESSNIVIANGGTAAESNVIRIGVQGSGSGQQNKCFLAGIQGVTGTSSAVVVGFNTSTDQLLQTTVTAGTGISVTPAGGTITISATGTTTLTYTAVAHGASPYTVLATDDYLGVDSTLGVVSILLPNAPATGRVFIVKDSKAQAVANNITVTTVGGAVTIDGATTYVMKTNYQSVQVIFNGTSYEVF
jgi:hypothetical protein